METYLEDRPIGDIGWMKDAACDGIDTEFFFPEVSHAGHFATIRALCGGCPVRLNCLDYANRQGLTEGWFGGVPPKERRGMRRDR